MKISFDRDGSNCNLKTFDVIDKNKKRYRVYLHSFSYNSIIDVEKEEEISETKKGMNILLEVNNYYFHNYYEIRKKLED